MSIPTGVSLVIAFIEYLSKETFKCCGLSIAMFVCFLSGTDVPKSGRNKQGRFSSIQGKQKLVKDLPSEEGGNLEPPPQLKSYVSQLSRWHAPLFFFPPGFPLVTSVSLPLRAGKEPLSAGSGPCHNALHLSQFLSKMHFI